MDITIHTSFLPHDDPKASLAFYRDILGFEVRNDVEYGGLHWITVGPPGQPGTSIVLHPPAADPGITEDERRTITEMMAKGTYAGINLATPDVDATFGRLQATDAEVVQEPTDQPWGIRDCAFRDPPRFGGPNDVGKRQDARITVGPVNQPDTSILLAPPVADPGVTEVCFEVGCSSLGTFSTRFTELVGVPPSVYRRQATRATAGMPPCVAKQVTRPVRNREAPVPEPQLA